MSFEEFPKIARLSRNCTITEKIDGTNAQVFIANSLSSVDAPWLATLDLGGLSLRMAAGSRNRWITPEADNFGFAAWVQGNAVDLWNLGEGRHYGEWWGSGIQRGYGLQKGEKRFSLFNTSRWAESWKGPDSDGIATRGPLGEKQRYAPESCYVVPILYAGPFSTEIVDRAVEDLRWRGSRALPGFMKPEGVVVYHEAARLYFKKTLIGDDEPKSRALSA